MEPVTHKDKIEAALNNEAVTAVVGMRLNHPCQGPCIFSDGLMSDGEKAIWKQRTEENAPKIAEAAARHGIFSRIYNEEN